MLPNKIIIPPANDKAIADDDKGDGRVASIFDFIITISPTFFRWFLLFNDWECYVMQCNDLMCIILRYLTSSTDIILFASETNYLHDNSFKVTPMSDLGYDESTNYMNIEQIRLRTIQNFIPHIQLKFHNLIPYLRLKRFEVLN